MMEAAWKPKPYGLPALAKCKTSLALFWANVKFEFVLIFPSKGKA
jgi:hypothetical protein